MCLMDPKEIENKNLIQVPSSDHKKERLGDSK